MHVQVKLSNKNRESYCLTCYGDLAEIEVNSPLVEQFAKSQLMHGLESGALGEFVGEHEPQFHLRPLWLEKLPDVLDVISLGYNAVIYTGAPNKEIFDEIRKCGLKLITPHAEYGDYLLCHEGESSFTPSKKEPTSFERACEEIEELERRFKKPLLYHTKKNCPYLLALSRLISKNSILSFDGYRHPVMQDLCRLPIVDETRLLPILEVVQADAFSNMPFKEIEDVLGRQRQKRFFGAGCRTTHLPKLSDFAALAPWLIGQRLWRQGSITALFDLWLMRYHPEWSTWLTRDLLEIIHRLFLHRDDMAKAIPTLLQLAEELSNYKVALRFHDISQDLNDLSNFLLQLQIFFKAQFEEHLAGRKIPLALQSFTPVAFAA